jgi:hypothetical protein
MLKEQLEMQRTRVRGDLGKRASGNKNAGKKDAGKKLVGTRDLADDRLAKLESKGVFENRKLDKEAAAKRITDINTPKGRIPLANEVEENPQGTKGQRDSTSSRHGNGENTKQR